ncbi:MAG: DUF1538 domain-containing protein [Ruminococcaceae bacterium]|nr:DUF1538 domain-containing protein [Oscillospiraceae bacterium]
MTKNQLKFQFQNKTILIEKLMESLKSVLPITLTVFFLCFFILPISTDTVLYFIIGAVFLTVGIGLFQLGADNAMSPIGMHIGAHLTRSKNLWALLFGAFILGIIITVSEPDLQILASTFPNIPNATMIFAVAVGVGLFLIVGILRVLFQVKLRYVLIAFYVLTFVLAFFADPKFLPVSFDSGGVTTGPMTVPSIIALGVGISSLRSDRSAESDSFGYVALCSIGPILTVLLLGFFFPSEASHSENIVPHADSSTDLFSSFIEAFPHYVKEVLFALLPVCVFFLIFQIFWLKLPKITLKKILIGLLYTFVGLVLFLTGANVGFMPMGTHIGQLLGDPHNQWLIIPVAVILGYYTVRAEPAVQVLTKQVYELTAGTIPQKGMVFALSVGVALAVSLSFIRMICGFSILWILVPGYIIALFLTFFVPPIFTAIAFDSGGIASGPLTSTFLLPLSIGLAAAMDADLGLFAFGIVALVAMMPIITVQALGLSYTIISRKKAAVESADEKDESDEFIELETTHE